MNWNRVLLSLFCLCVASGWGVNAAIITTNDFSTDPGGDVSSLSSVMTVSHDTSYMSGDFLAQDPLNPVFELDAFNVTLADFTGDYGGITQIAFDLFAVNIAPSFLYLNIVSGTNSFSYQFTDFTSATIAYQPYVASLSYSAGWSGAGEALFNSSLSSVDSIEILLARNSTDAQEYRLDNLRTSGAPGPSAVPEPNTVSIIMAAVLGLLAVRRRTFLDAART